MAGDNERSIGANRTAREYLSTMQARIKNFEARHGLGTRVIPQPGSETQIGTKPKAEEKTSSKKQR